MHRDLKDLPFDYLFEHNPVPMWIYDLESLRFLAVNNAAISHYGYSKDEFLSMTIKDIRPKEDIPALLENVAKVTTGIDNAGIWRHIKRDGTLIYVEIISHTIDYEGKRAELVLAYDVTERIRFENEIKNKNLELLILSKISKNAISSMNVDKFLEESLHEISIAVNVDIILLFLVDEELKKLTPFKIFKRHPSINFKKEESIVKIGECLCGLAFSELIPVFSQDITKDVRCTLPVCKDAGLKSFVALPLVKSEEKLGVIGMASISEQDFKKNEQFLNSVADLLAISLYSIKLFEDKKRNAELLERRVMERTAELEELNRKLRETNEKLKEMDRLKTIFLASMSHELRTPLNSIIGFTGVMLMGMSGEINEEQRKQLTIIQNSAQHLLDLINDVLDVSRIETGNLKLSCQEFVFDEVVKELSVHFLEKCKEKGIDLYFKIVKGARLYTDRRRLLQILINLLSNALKFTEKGKIEMLGEIENGGMLKIKVRDTGIGIREEDMNKLFQPFQQLARDISEKPSGTGLGLYLSKKLATLLGGEISASSKFGEGSEFIFTIPLIYKGYRDEAENPGSRG